MFKLQSKFYRLRRLAAPDRAYKRVLWFELSRAYDQEYRPEGRGLHWKIATVPVTVLVVVLLTGTGVYAYQSPEVSDGHPLFGLKQEMEQMNHMLFVHSPEHEEAFQNWVANRRLSEMQLKAKHLPLEVKNQIREVRATVEAQALSEEEKRALFHQEVEAILTSDISQ